MRKLKVREGWIVPVFVCGGKQAFMSTYQTHISRGF